MDFAQLSRELVRCLRGGRSQTWLSRRLGLKSNLVYRWESGRASPSAQHFFRICRVCHATGSIEVQQSLLGEVSPRQLETEEGVARLLTQLARASSIGVIAEKVGKSRFVVSRWLAGKTKIKLADLLRVIEATTGRLLDFCAGYVDTELVHSLARGFRKLQAARAAAYDLPWSHGVLRALELRDYRRAKGPTEQWLSQRLGIETDEAKQALSLLQQSGQIRRLRGRYVVNETGLVDTGVDRRRRRELRSFWARVALERLDAGTKGIHAFNLFTIAEQDLPQVEAWHSELFEKLRGLVSRSAPERLVLYSAQIVALDRMAST